MDELALRGQEMWACRRLGSCLKGRIEPSLGETHRLGEVSMSGPETVEIQGPASRLGAWAGERVPPQAPGQGAPVTSRPVFLAPHVWYPGAESDDSTSGHEQTLHLPPVKQVLRMKRTELDREAWHMRHRDPGRGQ